MEIESSAFQNGEALPSKYTCDGLNISPPLSFKGIPAGTVSLVLIADDPDAPGGDWTHWTVWNIDPSVSGISEGELPEKATLGVTDFGSQGYGGPCPPSGTHRYFFRLFALSDYLTLSEGATKKELLDAMSGLIIDRAELMGAYERS